MRLTNHRIHELNNDPRRTFDIVTSPLKSMIIV